MGKLTGKDRKEYRKTFWDMTRTADAAKKGENVTALAEKMELFEEVVEKKICILNDWTEKDYDEADADKIQTAEERINKMFGLDAKKN